MAGAAASEEPVGGTALAMVFVNGVLGHHQCIKNLLLVGKIG
jgi:hypothetical protein